MPLKSGIAGGSNEQEHYERSRSTNQQQLRTYQNHGLSGIIPKVKINYFEVATLTNGEVSKDECKIFIEQVIRAFSDKARNGQAVDSQIPHVGRFQVKNNIAGVIFDNNLIDDSRGQTAKRYDNIFGKSNNWMNNKIL